MVNTNIHFIQVMSVEFSKALKWVFPKIGVPENGWFIAEKPIKMDDLGVPLFLETPKCFPVVWNG